VNYNEIVDELKILKFLRQQMEKFQNFHFVDTRKKTDAIWLKIINYLRGIRAKPKE